MKMIPHQDYSSKTVSGIQFENTFDLEIEPKNVILVAFRFFAFLHSQGHQPTLPAVEPWSALPPQADIADVTPYVSLGPLAEVATHSVEAPGSMRS